MHTLVQKRLYKIPAYLGLLLLSACTTLGPDYEEPVVDWLQKQQPTAYGDISGEGASSENALVPKKEDKQSHTDFAFWWRVFNDPVLSKLIEDAKQGNYSLRIAGLRIFESRALLGIANSGLYPQLQQVNNSASYVENQSHGGNATINSQSFTHYQAGFNVG